MPTAVVQPQAQDPSLDPVTIFLAFESSIETTWTLPFWGGPGSWDTQYLGPSPSVSFSQFHFTLQGLCFSFFFFPPSIFSVHHSF